MSAKISQKLIKTLSHLRNAFVWVLLLSQILGFFGLNTSFSGIFTPKIAQATTGVPLLINFQGRLTNVLDGTNVTNGTYNMQFKLYDALSGGSLLWTETYDQAPVNPCQKVQVTAGVFNVKLGSCNSLSGINFTDDSLYLTVNFDSGAGYDGEMSPRKRLVSAPYAINANNVAGTGKINLTNTATTSTPFSLNANTLTTASGLTLTTTTNSAADTAWTGSTLTFNNTQGTTAVSTGSIAGLDIQFNQNTSIAGNTETAARIAVKQNNSTSTDATVSSLLALENNDSATGNQITVTDGLKITGSNITNGINLSGTFGTNLITSSNFSVAQSGAISGVGVNSGAGLIQGQLGLTVSGATVSLNDSSNFATTINTGTSTGNITIGSTTGAQAILLQSGTGDVTITSTDDFSFTATDDITINGGSAGSILNFGTNTHGNVINIGTDNTTSDTISIGSALDNVAITGDQWSITDAGALTVQSCSGCGGSSKLNAITAADNTNSIDSLNLAQTWDWSTLTSQNALSLSASGTGLTSGAVLKVSTASTGAISNGALQVSGSGNYSGTGGLLNVTSTASTAGTLVNLTNNTASFTGTIQSITANGLSTGTMLNLSSNGTTAGASQTGLNISLQGTNASAGITSYGGQISNTHAGTTSTNIALQLTASGGTTANYALITNGGNVGIGDTTPNSLFTVGSGDLFQINTSGQIGSQQAPVSDYLFALNGNNTNDNSRIIDIVQSNNAAEDSYAVYIANTANPGTVTSTRNIYNDYASLTPTATVDSGAGSGRLNLYGENQNINISNLTLGSTNNDYTVTSVYANKSNISGNITVNDPDDDDDSRLFLYGYYADIASTSTVLSGTLAEQSFGGYFASGSGNGSNTAIQANAYGTGTTNIGIYASAINGSTNYAGIFANGNVGIGTSSPAELLSVGTSSVFQINSSGDILTPATESLSITTGTTGVLTLDSGTTGAVNLGTGNNAKTISIGTGTAGNIINIGTNNTVSDTISIGSALDNVAITGDQWSITDAGALTVQSCSGCGGSSKLNAITAADNTNSIDSLNLAQTWDWSTLTSQNALSLSASGTGLTSGAVLKVSTASTGAISNGALQVSGSGNYSGTGGLLNVTSTASTAGTLVNLTNNTASFTGTIQSITANGLSTGTALSVSSSSTAITSASLLQGTFSGAPASSWTGDLAKFEATQADADLDGNILKLGYTGSAAGDGTVLNITTAQTGTSSYGLRVNDDGSYTDSSPFIVDASGNVGIGLTAPTSILHIQQAADVSSTSNPVALNINSVGASGELTASSGVQVFGQIAPTINQSGTAGYTTLLINNTQTATGSGDKKFLDLQIGGSSKIIAYNGTATASGATAIAGLYTDLTLTNSTASGFQYGNRFLNTVNGSTAGTEVGTLIRMTDSTSLANTVRGLEVQAWSGSNTTGINTGIAAFGKTFGIQGTTDALASGTAQAAALYADLDNGSATSSGNAIRAFTDNATGADMVQIYQEKSAYTGTGLLMNFGNQSSGTGSYAGNFIDLQYRASTKYKIHYSDSTSIITETINPTGSITDWASSTNGNTYIWKIPQKATTGTCSSAATEGMIIQNTGGTQVGHICIDGPTSGSPNKLRFYAEQFNGTSTDLAENYSDATNSLEAGDVVSLDENEFKGVKKSSQAYEANLAGVISTAPGLLLTDTSEDGTYKGVINPKPVALSGRVPVKFSNENGEVKVGDYLTSSKTQPGFAMKATKTGNILGQALENSSTNVTPGKILMFVKTITWNGEKPVLPAQKSLTTSYSVPTELLKHLASDSTDFLSHLTTDRVITRELVSDTLTANSLNISQLNFINPDGLSIDEAFVLKGGLKVNSITALDNLLSLNSDVEIIGRPFFNTDTAGFAVIKKGAQQVNVNFEKEYLDQPIINANITFEKAPQSEFLTPEQYEETAQKLSEQQAKDFFFSSIQFVVINKNTKGFTIYLSKPTTHDLNFSWIALAVKNPNIFIGEPNPNTSLQETPVVTSSVSTSIETQAISPNNNPNTQLADTPEIQTTNSITANDTEDADLKTESLSNSIVQEEINPTTNLLTESNPNSTPNPQTSLNTDTTETVVE